MFNSQAQRISWETSCSASGLDQPAANTFLTQVDILSDTCPPDIEIHKVRQSNFLRVTDEKSKKYLVIGKKQIGEILRVDDLEQVKANGGAIISQLINAEKRIISIISASKNVQPVSKAPINKNNEGSNLFPDIPLDKPSQEYFEGVIRIPKSLVYPEDLAKRLLDADVQLYRKLSELSSKVDRVVEHTERTKYQENQNIQRLHEERKVYELSRMIDDLQKQNQSLLSERQYLNNLIAESKMIAFNKLKDELKFSKVALSRNVDLDQISSVKNQITSILTDILKNSSMTETQIEELLNSDNTVAIIREFSDNIDSKIQSLKEIKKEFIDLSILETGGDK